MTGTPAFLVFFSLIARLHAIPLAVEGLAVLAVSCALLLLTRFEGAISCQTEIDTGISAAATLSAPDTHPPDHRPPRRRAQSLQRRQPNIWMPLPQPRRPRWSPERTCRGRLPSSRATHQASLEPTPPQSAKSASAPRPSQRNLPDPSARREYRQRVANPTDPPPQQSTPTTGRPRQNGRYPAQGPMPGHTPSPSEQREAHNGRTPRPPERTSGATIQRA